MNVAKRLGRTMENTTRPISKICSTISKRYNLKVYKPCKEFVD